MRHQESYI